MFIFPPMVIAESNELKEGDVCRKDLLKDKKVWKDKSRWKKCITLYKETSLYKEDQGRVAYEIARLYHYRSSSIDPINVEDLKKAKRYYKRAIKQNGMEAELISDAKKLLRIVESELKTMVKATPDIISDGLPIDSDASPPLNFVLSPQLSLGAKFGLTFRERRNRDLRDSKDDNDSRIQSELSLAGLMQLWNGVEMFAEVKFADEENYESVRKGGQTGTLKGKFSKGYFQKNNLMNSTSNLKVGRQRFKDFREWIYDENLDGLQVYSGFDHFDLELSVSTNLFDPQQAEDKTVNYVGFAHFPIKERHEMALFLVNRRERGPGKGQLFFSGISLKGMPSKNQRNWLYFANVSGSQENKNVSGFGVDIGWSVLFESPLEPYMTLGFAFGSGDGSPDDNSDKNFRQTGLQDNSAKSWGVTKVKYYGELFEPELSNMMIRSLGLGIRPFKNASLEIVYHHYSQERLNGPDNKLRNVGIKPNPTGKSKSLGQEIDLIFGTKMNRKFSLQVTAGLFLPGNAFADSDPALQTETKFEFRF